MGIAADLGSGPVCLDTVTFIYFMEEHPVYAPLVAQVFEQIDAGSLRSVTSGITLLETVVLPLRVGNRALADRYTALLTASAGLKMLPLSIALLCDAAYLRAHTQLKTPDAIQLAAATRSGCTSFVTNDRRMPRIPGVRIVQLSAYV